MKTARQVSFEILNRIFKDNSYSNIVLDSYLEKLDVNTTDRAFVSAIVYGVAERVITLDFELSCYLKQPLRKLKPQVLTILRIGAYQILYMDKVPASAAINECVKLTKNNGLSFASGLVNAVLRKISSNGITETDDLTVRYSMPKWLCDLWIENYGRDNAIALLEATFGAVETNLKVNTLRITPDKLIELLHVDGFEAVKSDLCENSLIVKGHGPLHKSDSYQKGLFHVQDNASQLCCKALDVCEGDTVLDICAAPGGKSFTLAEQMNNTGSLISMDVYTHRLDLIKNGADRLGITNLETKVNDGTVFNPDLPQADKILCDVPCAGLGVIRKKPEIRYKDPTEVDKLPDLQYSILCVSAEYLKEDGIIIYSTCSLNKTENEDVVNKFLSEHPGFESFKVLPELRRYGEDTDYITLMPHLHNCDGFFIAGIRKIKEV